MCLKCVEVRSQHWHFWRRNEFESGGTRPARSAGEKFLSCPFTLWLHKYNIISCCGERFREGQYSVWSVSCLLFFYSRCPPPTCPAICESGGGARAPVPHRAGDGAHWTGKKETPMANNCFYWFFTFKCLIISWNFEIIFKAVFEIFHESFNFHYYVSQNF